MASKAEEAVKMPHRVEAALNYLYHCRCVTDRCDASLPEKELTRQEDRVRVLALRVLGQYFAGEALFDEAPTDPPKREDEGGAEQPVPSPVG